MERKQFLKNSLLGFGIMAIPSTLRSCQVDETSEEVLAGSETSSDSSSSADSNTSSTTTTSSSESCTVSPSETEGPYPIKTPSQLVRENIIGDRTGVALLINITVQDQSEDCAPLEGVLVDVWHCDKDGNYSQYNSYASANFLRGRQTTDENGVASFLSVFPGWYPGRAPHIHIEILSASGSSLLVSQIAFPADIYNEAYSADGYNGAPDTSNTQDNIFSNSLEGNLADSISGNNTDGYTLNKTIVVS